VAADDEAVVDRALARRYDLAVVDRFDLMGRRFTIAGLSEGTASCMTTFIFTFILADEPTANLDPKVGHEIMRLLRSIVKDQGRSVLIVSHDQPIKDIADRVLWLEDGELKEATAMAASGRHEAAPREAVRYEAVRAGGPR